MTEDIGELKSELSNVLLYYESEPAFTKLCAMIPIYEEKKKKQTELQGTFEKRIAGKMKDFYSLAENVFPDRKTALARERNALHQSSILQARKHLQEAYKDKFDPKQFAEAKSYISDSLNESEQAHTIRQQLMQSKEQSEQTKQPIQKNKDFMR